MILSIYFKKVFIQKFVIIVLISTLLATFVEFLQRIQVCSECQLNEITLESLYGGILFVYHALFFIIAITCMWFSVKLMSTLEIQISTTYRYHMMHIAKDILKVIFFIAILYIFVIDGIIINWIQNKQQYNNTQSSGGTKSTWISELKNNDTSVNGNIYYLGNIKKNRLGFYIQNATIFNIQNEIIVSYKKYNNVFISTHSNDVIFFTLLESGDKKKEIQKHKLDKESLKKINNTFVNKINHHSIYDIIIKVKDGYTSHTNELPFAINIVQNALSFVLSFLIVLSELLSWKSIRSNFARRGILKVMIYLIISYTICEVVKVVGTDSLYSQIISTTLTLSLIFIFLSRATKIHHQI